MGSLTEKLGMATYETNEPSTELGQKIAVYSGNSFDG